MAGNNYTLVDIYHIPMVQRLLVCGNGNLVSDRRNVNAWWERCLSRPAVKKYIDEVPTLEAIKKRLAASKS